MKLQASRRQEIISVVISDNENRETTAEIKLKADYLIISVS